MPGHIAGSSSSSSEQQQPMELVDRKGPATEVGAMGLENGDLDHHEFAGTEATAEDKVDMHRLGKKQQLIRHFRLLSTVSFVAMATAAWEIGLFLTTQGLTDGGTGGLIWSVVWNFVGFCPIYLSMAEMASMAPTAGGQYHWVSEFAHPNHQKWLSYLTGWTSTMAWQAGNAIGVFLTGTLIQVIILENNPDYLFPTWQGSLLVMAIIVLVGVINIFGAKIIPKLQNAIFALHIMAYICFIVPIWVNAPKASASAVFGGFSNSGGWSSMGLAVLAGQLSGIYTQVGVDTAAHIAEEVKNASKAVPRAMMSVYVINFVLIFFAIITTCFAMPDLTAALSDPSLYATVYVLKQSMSTAWLTVVLVMIIFLLICSNVAYLTAVTRDLFAFSRDNGLPFSGWVSKIHPKYHVPVNAVLLTSLISFILSLIYIGSSVAFYAITSLLTVALLQCYLFSIGSILWRRIYRPESLPPSHFSLGRWGVPINIAGVIYAAWAFFWSFWPIATPVTAAGFNWASVIFIGVLMIALIHYLVKARHVYTGPVVLIRQH
ncbi:hypothetical protein LTR78_009923 [Recurvomyces mirabilis]|uniref:GABA permease n=1 Tax=Recurvomyces mirabilis TaxID=574656 RepID=A0AAE0TQX0_9PEZI|nr:hypothetical protein LTR78_009923 [Recurvomyces mirabilis]KAK5160355.1 hypothetical protein LTS14_001367 [Recurvomyces mirabilis]